MKDVRIFIPARNGARWIGPFLDGYRRNGIEPLYVVDSRSSDTTLDILKSKNADFVIFTPSADFAEAGMIEFGSRRCGTPWVLRLDDDEFPSQRLLDWLERFAPNSRNQTFSLSRRELFARGGRIYFSRSISKYHGYDRTYLHPQPRFHHVDRVSYIEQVHSTGVFGPTYSAFVPPDAYFIHLSCLLRSPTERLEKIAAYETIAPKVTMGVADEYLPELFSLEHHNPDASGLEEFAYLFKSLPIETRPVLPAIPEPLKQGFVEAVHAHTEAIRSCVPLLPRDADQIYSRLSVLRPELWRYVSEFLCTIGARRPGEWLWNFDSYCRKQDVQVSQA